MKEILDVADYLKGKNVVLVGYPGAFTPVCMAKHIPEYISGAEEMLSKGVDEVIALTVNDPFVVTKFGESLGSSEHVTFMADGNGDLTKAMDMGVDLSHAQLSVRSKRFSMIV